MCWENNTSLFFLCCIFIKPVTYNLFLFFYCWSGTVRLILRLLKGLEGISSGIKTYYLSKELKSIRWKTHFSPPIPLITHTPHYPLQVYPSSVGKCMHIFAFMYASNIHMASCYIHSSFLPHNFFIAVKNISVLWGSIYILKY